jgi:hypothetical protein
MPTVMTKRYAIPKMLIVYASNDSQMWRGLFRSPFILQTFATHLLAIDGCVQVPGLHNKPTPHAIGGLGWLLPRYLLCFVFGGLIDLIIDRWSGL